MVAFLITLVLVAFAWCGLVAYGHGRDIYKDRKAIASRRRSVLFQNTRLPINEWTEPPALEDFSHDSSLYTQLYWSAFALGISLLIYLTFFNGHPFFLVLAFLIALVFIYSAVRAEWAARLIEFEADQEQYLFPETPIDQPPEPEKLPGVDPFEFEQNTRFEHTMIVAAPGMGKTSIMSTLIARDLKRSCTVVVFDSQGDLVDKLVRVDVPRDRVVYIDPTDVEHPPALAIFDVKTQGDTAYERERNFNATVEMLLFVLESADSSVTSKQRLPLEMLIRLCLTIPNATLHTLMDLLADDTFEQYETYVKLLPAIPRQFFERDYRNRDLKDTREQIRRRIYTIMTISGAMFSATKNRFDMRRILDDGSIVLVNTANSFLRQEGSILFTRFLSALIFQAIEERDPTKKNMPVYLYIDEAGPIIADHTIRIFEQGRKYSVGMHVAFQNLSQLAGNLQHRLIGSTAIKFFSGSAKDAVALAADMRTKGETLMQAGKLHFYASVRGKLGQFVDVKHGILDTLPKRDDLKLLLKENRAKYSVPREPSPPRAGEPDTQETQPKSISESDIE